MNQKEKRAARRKKAKVDFEYFVEGTPVKARTENLSENGAFINAELDVDTGGVVQFRIGIPDSHPGGAIEGEAKVVWRAPVGVGVEFCALNDASRKRLKLFLA